MVDGPPLYRSKHVYVPPIPKSKLGFDEIYMVNLLRRPERRERMRNTLYDLGIDAKFFDAIDGKKLNDTYLDSLGIDMLPGFADPYHGRALTMGEIGCFLSHYTIWEEMVSKNYEKILIFEDDVRFEPFFDRKLAKLMKEVEEFVPNWDLIYLGRKRLDRDSEIMVKGSSTLIWPSYSYWTLSYILSRRGADKLLSHKPLHRMVPVDEYLPILFDKHPTEEWKIQFKPRNLVGLSAEPLLLYPTHYTGEANYFSDTEESSVIETEDYDTDNEESLVGNTERFNPSKNMDLLSKDEL
ncbi:glycosyltransferase 25 family member [Patella vulgata]|uniref:glycosyltransferase 25 family member n=1 Tax=Patella vulgata TaxID=6465 RepID=UPI0021806B6E|nr:glycosyltransferase 25 family member [Patella vulgata]